MKMGSEYIIKDIEDTIQKILQLITLRHKHVLVQFWSPCKFGKHTLLKTIDQPFRLDITNDGLGNYRRASELVMFAVDDTFKEEDLNPVIRVFKRGMPEWTCDVTNLFQQDYEQHRDSAFVRWNLHGYLFLPVFDSFTMLCAGVLEFVTTSKYSDCAYEVQEVHRILKETNLKSPQTFVGPASNAIEQDKIIRILKVICVTYKIPIAKTWALSPLTSFVVTGRHINKTCSSFSSSCIGKTCLSTNELPFYVQDNRYVHFREACSLHHLHEATSVVGRALSSHGSSFCRDVSKLNEEEYSLVHMARATDLTSCFAIYLRSIEHDAEFVLEFFLPIDMKEDADLQNFVEDLKLHFTFSSGFELGELLNTTLIELSTEVSKLSLAIQPDIIHTSLTAELVELDLLTEGETSAQIDCVNAQDERDSRNDCYNFMASPILENTIGVEEGCGSVENKISVKPRRKRKLQSFTLETLQQYFKMPIGEASKSLDVSRSTLKCVCRDLGIPTWPLPHRITKYAPFGIYTAALLLVKLKRWSCSSHHHVLSPRWWTCDKHKDFVSKSKISREENESTKVTSPLTILPIPEPACPTPSFSKPPHEQFGIYQVTVKATYNHDTVKFQFPVSSGLLQLKTQVAQRIRLESTKFYLKYRDEDDDLILIACDADLRSLTLLSGISGSNVTLNLFVEIIHDKNLSNGNHNKII